MEIKINTTYTFDIETSEGDVRTIEVDEYQAYKLRDALTKVLLETGK